MRAATVLRAALSIPCAATLKLAEQLLILHVSRLHGNGLTRILHCLRIVVQACLSQCAQVIPACIALACRYRIQRVKRLSIVPGIDIVLRSAHFDHSILFLLILLALSAVAVCSAEERCERIILRSVSALTISPTISAIAAVSVRALLLSAVVAASSTRAAALTAMHNLFIRLLDFHESLLRLRSVRLADVCIRMISLAELTICLFYLVVCRRRGNPQHLIRICHCSFFAFLLSLAISNRCQIPE